MKFFSHSARDTFGFAKDFSRTLEGGEIITLSGELGVGKSVFAKGLCFGLGVKDDVLSPTFTIMNDYRGDKFTVCHYDAYRLSSGEEAYFGGFTDYFGQKDTVCVIEWAENIASALTNFKLINVTLKRVGDEEREIEIQ